MVLMSVLSASVFAWLWTASIGWPAQYLCKNEISRSKFHDDERGDAKDSVRTDLSSCSHKTLSGYRIKPADLHGRTVLTTVPRSAQSKHTTENTDHRTRGRKCSLNVLHVKASPSHIVACPFLSLAFVLCSRTRKRPPKGGRLANTLATA